MDASVERPSLMSSEDIVTSVDKLKRWSGSAAFIGGGNRVRKRHVFKRRQNLVRQPDSKGEQADVVLKAGVLVGGLLARRAILLSSCRQGGVTFGVFCKFRKEPLHEDDGILFGHGEHAGTIQCQVEDLSEIIPSLPVAVADRNAEHDVFDVLAGGGGPRGVMKSTRAQVFDEVFDRDRVADRDPGGSAEVGLANFRLELIRVSEQLLSSAIPLGDRISRSIVSQWIRGRLPGLL